MSTMTAHLHDRARREASAMARQWLGDALSVVALAALSAAVCVLTWRAW